jgi:class 3 adenylate cyclase/DNA-binding winged helix-turn-helix (wHTH) protein
VLAYLIGHRDRVVSKDELLEHLWPNQFIGDGTLNACLMAVRKSIGDSGQAQRYIHTLHGRGYRFVAAVEEQDDTPLGHATVSLAHPAQGAEALTRGHPAVIATPAPGPADPATSVSPFLPREAQEPPASPTLDHEYKYVTVLCCGLTAAAPLAAQLGAEAMHHLMQTFFTSAQTTVERYGGSLLDYGGDGFLALFGAPVAHEDHARQAVLAALELRQRLGTPQALPGHQHRAPLAVSMGVHTGPVVVGGLDINPQRLYTALGTTTALAAHLQHVAPSEGIVLSAATYQLVQEEVQGEEWESSAGSETPLLRPVYTVRGITQRRAGVPRRRSPYYSPFIGRAQELAILQARLAQAERGQGQCIGITGEPGIGKSRLLTEFQRRMGDQQVTVRAGQCLPYGRATPYLPLLTLLRQHCRITDTDLTDAIRANVQHAAQEAHLSAEEAAILLQLLDVSIETTPLALCSPEVRQARIFAVLRQVLVHSRQQPLLLVMEDIHWIDPTSEAWLAAVMAGLADRAVLILVTYRPGYQPPWMGHSCVTQLALSSLSPQESLLVVQAVPQITQGPDHLRQAIVAQAAGNPFFLEELAWTVVEHGDVAAPLRIPETIQAVLAARIDRLPQDTKRLLQLACSHRPRGALPAAGRRGRSARGGPLAVPPAPPEDRISV